MQQTKEKHAYESDPIILLGPAWLGFTAKQALDRKVKLYTQKND